MFHTKALHLYTAFMKPIFYLFCFYLIVPADAFSQTEERPRYAPRKEKHRNKTDEMGRKQGTWKYFNSYGQIMLEIEYQDNARNGVTKQYYQYAKVMRETEYHFGIKDGVFKQYYYSGQVKTEGAYASGSRSERWTSYYSDGQMKSEGAYKNGSRDGDWKFYDHKGQLAGTITYKNGVDMRDIMAAEKKAAAAKAKKDLKKTPADNKVPVSKPK
jgi:hypothetical protein